MAATERRREAVRAELRRGLVIPAHPLALTAARALDERRQAALTRYYCAAGAGGIAVGVHTTQFAIRDPGVRLLEPVLALAMDVLREDEAESGRRRVAVAGVLGPTRQAVAEAELARDLGYDLALLSLGALGRATVPERVAHCRSVGEVLPLFGFYLQPAVGGIVLDYAFWREFLEIEAVAAIKVAPFDRYRTLDVVRAVAACGRDDVSLYTGNDDAIVADLLAAFPAPGRPAIHFAGGLLGQWAVWTRQATVLLARAQACRATGAGALELMALGAQLTDANAALFDARHAFAGCIPGLHEVLRRQGLLAGRWCLDPAEDLSPGQMEEIDRVLAAYPHLADDEFVAENRERWLL
ncbi:MAG TPA: dihydrodipicolinate synthase family protein [Vicinamibacteria bacterium]|nr:dihydrodipicolinate synthase family protein [Vicinamibacteria bacterium]